MCSQDATDESRGLTMLVSSQDATDESKEQGTPSPPKEQNSSVQLSYDWSAEMEAEIREVGVSVCGQELSFVL